MAAASQSGSLDCPTETVGSLTGRGSPVWFAGALGREVDCGQEICGPALVRRGRVALLSARLPAGLDVEPRLDVALPVSEVPTDARRLRPNAPHPPLVEGLDGRQPE